MKIQLNGSSVVLATEGCYCQENIEISAKEPEGTLEITRPGTYDVSKYATVVVNITAATQEV